MATLNELETLDVEALLLLVQNTVGKSLDTFHVELQKQTVLLQQVVTLLTSGIKIK